MLADSQKKKFTLGLSRDRVINEQLIIRSKGPSHLKGVDTLHIQLTQVQLEKWPLKRSVSITKIWRFGVAVTHWSRSTQLLYIEPG